MKKLLIATAAAALAGGAFANPLVYDYKASVKHFYLKPVRVADVDGSRVRVYQKVQKSASLKGYLIVDDDGVTSKTIGDNQSAGCYDQGRNRAFLVVMNSSASASTRQPKILPAVLEGKWFDPKLSVSKGVARTGVAEGTLFVGGESIAPVRPRIDLIDGVDTERGVDTIPGANTPGMTAYADYVWTSVYLFGGEYNGPNWFGYELGLNPFDQFEKAWDDNLPEGVKTGREDGNPVYHDTWLNGAGIGKYIIPGQVTTGDVCCGLQSTTTSFSPIIESLSGNLKGGIYLCTDNGIYETGEYEFLGGITWDDQFVTAGHFRGIFTYNEDKWQTDLWQDGAVEQETTDVVFGTWSIKRNTKTIAREITNAEIELLAQEQLTINNTVALLSTVKGAILTLKSTAPWYNGQEIYTMTPQSRFNIPVTTPQFLKFYGLVD